MIVPTIFFFSFFLERSFNEISTINTEYYENMCKTFAGTFTEEISGFKMLVLKLSERSRDSLHRDEVIYEGTEKMAENPYYYSQASKELNEFGINAGKISLGVYYYDADFILYDEKKYSVEWMIKTVLELGDKDEACFDKMRLFFDVDSYANSRVLFTPVYNEDEEYEGLLVGVCTTMGRNREKVLCFYLLEPKDMDFFYQSTQGRSWEKYYVLDGKSKELLYSIGEAASGMDAAMFEVLLEQEESSRATRQEAYILENEKYNLTFVLDVSGDEEQNSVLQFYNDMKTYMFYVLFLMILVSVMAIWFNYRPIRILLKNIKTDGKNEFDVIFNSWEEQNLRLTEQRTMIMDLLMNRLLHGLPISEEQMGKLGVSEEIKAYCVFMIEEYVLLSEETAHITQKLENDFETLAFVTDLQGENTTVIVIFMRQDERAAIFEWLTEWCADNIKVAYALRYGCTVESLDDIRTSLLECKKQGMAAENSKTDAVIDERMESKKRAENYEVLKEDILAYLEENYGDRELTQTKVADHFCISVYSMSRVFKKQFGVGFAEYINGKRLEKAKQMLQTTEIPIKEIASCAGFADANYFSRIFKKDTGMSPSQYRDLGK